MLFSISVTGRLRIYIDGALRSEVNSTLVPAAVDRPHFTVGGHHHYAKQGFCGRISGVKVWNQEVFWPAADGDDTSGSCILRYHGVHSDCHAPAVVQNPEFGQMPVKGRVALITGASSGIGLAVADVLAAHGMKVILTARRESMLQENARKIRANGGIAHVIAMDVTQDASMRSAFDEAERVYGGIDFVFANAGIDTGNDNAWYTLGEWPEEFMFRMFNINLLGAMRTMKYASLAFERRGGGVIAFCSSTAASTTPHRSLYSPPTGSILPYSTTKVGMDWISHQAAGAYANANVRSYSLQLGSFESEAADQISSMLAPGDEGKAIFGSWNPIFTDSMGHSPDVGKVVLALLDRTTLWPSGSTFIVDHNVTMAPKYLQDHSRGMASGWKEPADTRPYWRDSRGAPL